MDPFTPSQDDAHEAPHEADARFTAVRAGDTAAVYAARNGYAAAPNTLHQLAAKVNAPSENAETLRATSDVLNSTGKSPRHKKMGRSQEAKALSPTRAYSTATSAYLPIRVQPLLDTMKVPKIEGLTHLQSNTEQKSGEPEDLTPMHAAARKGWANVVHALHQLEVPLNLRDQSGATPLYYAACGGHLDTVKLLRSLGAYVGTPNFKGESPMQAAERQGYSQVAQALRPDAVSPTATDAISANQIWPAPLNWANNATATPARDPQPANATPVTRTSQIGRTLQ